MKNLLAKVLLTSLLLSAAMPFSIQANLFASFKDRYDSNKWVHHGTNITTAALLILVGRQIINVPEVVRLAKEAKKAKLADLMDNELGKAVEKALAEKAARLLAKYANSAAGQEVRRVRMVWTGNAPAF